MGQNRPDGYRENLTQSERKYIVKKKVAKFMTSRVKTKMPQEKEVERILSQLQIEIEPESTGYSRDITIKRESPNEIDSLIADSFTLQNCGLHGEPPAKLRRSERKQHVHVSVPTQESSFAPRTVIQPEMPSVVSVRSMAKPQAPSARPQFKVASIKSLSLVSTDPSANTPHPLPQKGRTLTLMHGNHVSSPASAGPIFVMPSGNPLYAVPRTMTQVFSPARPFTTAPGAAPRVVMSTVSPKSHIATPIQSSVPRVVVPLAAQIPPVSLKPQFLMQMNNSTFKPPNPMRILQVLPASSRLQFTTARNSVSPTTPLFSQPKIPTETIVVRSTPQVSSAPTPVSSKLVISSVKSSIKSTPFISMSNPAGDNAEKNPSFCKSMKTYTNAKLSGNSSKVQSNQETTNAKPSLASPACVEIKVEPDLEDLERIAINSFENCSEDSSSLKSLHCDSFILPDVSSNCVPLFSESGGKQQAVSSTSSQYRVNAPRGRPRVLKRGDKPKSAKREGDRRLRRKRVAPSADEVSSLESAEMKLASKDVSTKISNLSFFEESDMSDVEKAKQFFLLAKQVMTNQDALIKDYRKMLARVRFTVDVLMSEEKITDDVELRLVKSFNKN